MKLKQASGFILDSFLFSKVMKCLEPVISRLEGFFGKGGNLSLPQKNSHGSFEVVRGNDNEDILYGSIEMNFNGTGSSPTVESPDPPPANSCKRASSELSTILEEESALISDDFSAVSETNSRNFQQPERDFIKDLSLQREKLMTDDVPSNRYPQRNTISASPLHSVL